jgi:hypothetical protein
MNAPEPLDEPPRPLGRIITFYSYKGGTGRSMALANVAWILASNGCRVLAVDRDLEAPGLHRYFRPFLSDDELTETPGLIDFFVHFTEAARLQTSNPPELSASGRPWFYDRADLLRYSISLDNEFQRGGALDFICAGQQGPSYGQRVNSFQWSEFYEKLGGGIFIEAMKAQLREQYEYVLVDSRTGLSDASGICTVQIPDELVVCFTLNRQSIFGTAAIAESADAQRRLPNGEQALRIWPVPTRVELYEKDKLEAARLIAREKFAAFLWHIPAPRRIDYWGEIEMRYFPYYAYEEVLAPIGDPPKQTTSLLNSMERLAARLTNGKISAMPPQPPGLREQLLARYQPMTTAIAVQEKIKYRFFLSHSAADKSDPIVKRLAALLDREFGQNSAFWDARVPLGANWAEALDDALRGADVFIAVIGSKWAMSDWSAREAEIALNSGKMVIPLLLSGVTFERLPPELAGRRGITLSEETLDKDLHDFIDLLTDSLPRSASIRPNTHLDVNDPQKGQWGGRSERAGRQLTARVIEGERGWFRVRLAVETTSAAPLEGYVEFHLHPSFRPPVIRVPARDGRAVLECSAWGAFTAGVAADGGLTRLELDLSELSDAPALFRER